MPQLFFSVLSSPTTFTTSLRVVAKLRKPGFQSSKHTGAKQIADVVVSRCEDPKLIIRVINFELVQHMCQQYLNITDGQTDRQTTYDSHTALALHASRGRN